MSTINHYEFLCSKTPETMLSDDVKKVFQVWGAALDAAEARIEALRYRNVVTNDGYLDELGSRLGVSRNGLSDSRYRRRMQIAYQRLTFVPLMDNFITFIRNLTDSEVTIKEEWLNGNTEPAKLTVEIVIPDDEYPSLIDELQELYSDGVRVEYKPMKKVTARTVMCGTSSRVGNIRIPHNNYVMTVPYYLYNYVRAGKVGASKVGRIGINTHNTQITKWS